MPEPTIADRLERLIDAKEDIDTAITEKGGTVTKGLENSDDDIMTIPTGGGGGGADVIFYDYDGTIVTSYSAADFANLAAMPANPSHTGLTAQGWNWTLADAKAYVATNGKLNIGQMYITSDGKTRLYFTVTKDSLTTDLYLNLGNDTELDIDWGDNSTHTTWTSADSDNSKSHTYASAGRYVIAIEVITGEFTLSTALSNIYKVEIGNGLVNIGDNAFDNCYTLSSITIPNSVTSIGDNAFNFSDSSALSSITIPNSVTSIGSGTFYGCYSLSSITIPDGVTSIGDNAFYYCYSLSSITIPDGVTSIGDNAFNNCYSLLSITIPDDVTSISNDVFNNCYSLSSITIPDGVTSIDSEAFSYCYTLSSITIPNSVTSIGGYAFYGCSALLSIIFESSTPPVLDGNLGLPKTCIIRVPQGTLSNYTSASNYPNPSNYIYEEY